MVFFMCNDLPINLVQQIESLVNDRNILSRQYFIACKAALVECELIIVMMSVVLVISEIGCERSMTMGMEATVIEV